MTVKSWIKWWVPSGLLTTIRKVKKNTNGKPAPQLQKGSPLPRRSLTDLFPGIESENITLSVEGFFLKDEYLLPIHEYLALMSICRHRKPSRIFEFGTYIGLTTLGLAMNTPEDTEIFTLDLDPSTRQTHKHGLGIGGFPSFEVG